MDWVIILCPVKAREEISLSFLAANSLAVWRYMVFSSESLQGLVQQLKGGYSPFKSPWLLLRQAGRLLRASLHREMHWVLELFFFFFLFHPGD